MKKTLALLAALLLLAAPAQAQSLKLTLQKTITTSSQAADAAPEETGDNKSETETLTLYPQQFSLQMGSTEKIYDFKNKAIFVVDHKTKTYLVYPLHAIPILYDRERTHRLSLKLARNKAMGQEGKQSFRDVSLIDIDLETLFSAKSTDKTGDMIATEVKGDKTLFMDGSFVMTSLTLRDNGTLPETLKGTYARFLTYETSIHPKIEAAIGKHPEIFSTLEYSNRDSLRKKTTRTKLTLVESTAQTAIEPSLPAGYKQNLSTDPRMNDIMQRSLEIPLPDKEELRQKIRDHLKEHNNLQAYLVATEPALTLSAADVKRYMTFIRPGLAAGENFEENVLTAITRQPKTEHDLGRFIKVLEAAKERAGDQTYLIDYFIAFHTLNVLGRKQNPTPDDSDALVAAEAAMLASLDTNPRVFSIYIDLGTKAFQNYDVLNAFLYWEHAARLNASNPSMGAILRMKMEAERDFPEFF